MFSIGLAAREFPLTPCPSPARGEGRGERGEFRDLQVKREELKDHKPRLNGCNAAEGCSQAAKRLELLLSASHALCFYFPPVTLRERGRG